MGNKQWLQALDLLQPLTEEYPKSAELYKILSNIYVGLGDAHGVLHAAQTLAELEPRTPLIQLNLAGAYLANSWPAIALRVFRNFLRRWPGHPRAAEVNETVAKLGQVIHAALTDLGLPEADGLAVLELHEDLQVQLQLGHYERAQQLAAEVLRRKPDFAPALNNLAQAQALQGRYAEAIATCDRVLAFQPDNIHALSNRLRCLVLSGRLEEAEQAKAPLLASQAPATDGWVKKAEALAYLGDDEAMLALFSQIPKKELSSAHAMLWHYAAVAACMLGKESDARRYWQEALKHNPTLSLARANLDDLKRPVGEREGPWPFTLNYWLRENIARELERAARDRRDNTLRDAVREVLAHHPEITALAPRLLERGGREGREFILRLAEVAATPELLEATKAFALGRRGSDAMRMKVAQTLAMHGLLPRGAKTRLWLRGEWQDMLMLGFEVHGEPVRVQGRSPQVERWLDEAHARLRAEEWEAAEQLLQKAVQAEPNQPDLLYNLSAIYLATGRKAQAEALWEQIHASDPDYLFARTALAQRAAKCGEVERARQLLDPLLSRVRLHYSELSALAAAYIELLLAEGQHDSALSWLKMWEEIRPDDPALDHYRSKLGQAERPRMPRLSQLSSLLRRRHG
ncbi:MAG: tetratricopeptide repeat protein [Anaerolineales bacterium]|nr:tetratricopeptide repeat protein [Anaerolineales bacterium]